MDIWNVDLDTLSDRDLRQVHRLRKREIAKLDADIKSLRMQHRRIQRFWEIFVEIRGNVTNFRSSK